MATPKNVFVFVGTMEIDPSVASSIGDALKDVPSSVTIKFADGTWFEFKDFTEENEWGTISQRHRAAIGPGGVLQVVSRKFTTWKDEGKTILGEDTDENVVVVGEANHGIVKIFAPAAWREVEGAFGEWIAEGYSEKSLTREPTKKDGQ